jgi:hypothetical protein
MGGAPPRFAALPPTPTRGRSARARWSRAAELATVRRLLRVERLLSLASWRLEDYRRVAAWVGLLRSAAVAPARVGACPCPPRERKMPLS